MTSDRHDRVNRSINRAVTYGVTISAYRTGRRTNLHTFVSAVDDHDGSWWVKAEHSHRQRLGQQARTRGGRTRDTQPDPPRRTMEVAELSAERVDLGDGVTPQGLTLKVVLEALRSDNRHKLDLDDLKAVLSQLGSRITALPELSDEQRQHAVPALFNLILQRCTSI